jgi:hypothetical protein
VFKSKVLRNTFLPEMGEVSGQFIALHNAKLHQFYRSLWQRNPGGRPSDGFCISSNDKR